MGCFRCGHGSTISRFSGPWYGFEQAIRSAWSPCGQRYRPALSLGRRILARAEGCHVYGIHWDLWIKWLSQLSLNIRNCRRHWNQMVRTFNGALSSNADPRSSSAACKIWYRRKQKPLVTATAPQALGSDTPFVYRDGDSVASFKRVRMMWTRSNSVEPSNIQAGHSQDGVHASQHDNFLPLLFAMKHPRKTNEGPHSRVPSCSMTDARGRMMRKELKKHVRKEIMNWSDLSLQTPEYRRKLNTHQYSMMTTQ